MRAGKTLGALLTLFAVGVLPACEPAERGAEMEAEEAPPGADERDPTAELPEADADALWAHLGDESYAEHWAPWPGRGEFYEGTEPHGALLNTYVNAEAADAFETGAPAMPPGAIVVKENYSTDRILQAITVMYKLEGYNPGAGDWFWAKYLPDGSVDGEGSLAGRPAACIECHGAAADNDYLLTGPLDPDADAPRR